MLVTGTDTGVGKTIIAAGLVLALRQRGAKAVGFKPVETGLATGGPPDSEILVQASGVDEPLARPLLQLREPLAPAVAADRAGCVLEPARIEERLAALRAAGYTVVVEGAGGLLVPLAWGYTALDLAVRAGLDAVVVARPGLGTLNHTLLTTRTLTTAGVRLRGVVVNGAEATPDLAQATNPAALARLLPGVDLIVVRRLEPADSLALARWVVPLLAPLLA